MTNIEFNSHFRKQNKDVARLLIKCPDQPGIVSAVSTFLMNYGANIIESSQYSANPEGGNFFIRMEFSCPDLHTRRSDIEQSFQEISTKFNMDYEFKYVSDIKKTAIFVSKELHCLMELLWEWQNGDLIMDIGCIISNSENAEQLAKSLNIPFYYIPANKDIRMQVEEKQMRILKEHDIELIILARYMQILTPNFVSHYPNQIINIHHSFLPAFIGARPYERAYERGVKLIGATSHYVTNDLDEGPIIEQGVERVSHHDKVDDLKRIGRNIERSVLARGVKWHLQDRVIVDGNKTIVF
ncbi:formyltetrahydrofolate deformylase [Lederbergia wuyishanensis]|uniref:Formyltetrahydrofolate deformylase n=1 Tax=Lederbergia wuyishanensis TaxID=1347903 RepID=A0ABU0D0W6_9BACI|nr:formyltetrahydrofolate deformylase [Lederbergia wuyishanensis]MCJ8006662.1 formyltetrahydrofolate deformylase [Lederbergia wuyishanensis]MDQ0342044.1 formyltetrahydrofolate deformylase [Lederbergia wuyishanensis]